MTSRSDSICTGQLPDPNVFKCLRVEQALKQQQLGPGKPTLDGINSLSIQYIFNINHDYWNSVGGLSSIFQCASHFVRV